MLKRTLTGVVIVALCAGFISLREVSPYFFDAFALAIIFGTLIEMNLSLKLFNKKSSKILSFIYPVALFAIFAFIPKSGFAGKELVFVFLALILAFAIMMVKELIINAIKRKRGETEKDEKLLNASLLNETKDTISLLVYPTTLLGFFFGINHMGLGVGYVGIILAFAVTMMTDVFAYLFGSLIKGARMAPEISPKKSIAGMIFGFVGGIAAAGVALWLFYFEGLFNSSITTLSLGSAIAIFAIVGVVGSLLTQMGDLVASSIKRKVGIKDFGSIFPGHGGFMDRMDGLMFNVALIYLVFTLFL